MDVSLQKLDQAFQNNPFRKALKNPMKFMSETNQICQTLDDRFRLILREAPTESQVKGHIDFIQKRLTLTSNRIYNDFHTDIYDNVNDEANRGVLEDLLEHSTSAIMTILIELQESHSSYFNYDLKVPKVTLGVQSQRLDEQELELIFELLLDRDVETKLVNIIIDYFNEVKVKAHQDNLTWESFLYSLNFANKFKNSFPVGIHHRIDRKKFLDFFIELNFNHHCLIDYCLEHIISDLQCPSFDHIEKLEQLNYFLARCNQVSENAKYIYEPNSLSLKKILLESINAEIAYVQSSLIPLPDQDEFTDWKDDDVIVDVNLTAEVAMAIINVMIKMKIIDVKYKKGTSIFIQQYVSFKGKRSSSPDYLYNKIYNKEVRAMKGVRTFCAGIVQFINTEYLR